MKHEIKAENVEFQLDITDETCPLTFVRTKLLLERMAPGQVAVVRLKGAEPLDNVPKAVRDHGHTVLSLTLEDSATPDKADAIYRLVVRRN
jgi:TusA-related sulfurtransferase